MKVLHLGKFYPPVRGGMETMLELICSGTAAAVENTVLVANTTSETTQERRGSVDVVRAAAVARVGAVTVCPTLPVRLAAEKADLVVIHEPNPMGLLAYFFARPSGRLVVWFHSEVIRPSLQYRLFYRPFLQFALARAARIVVASPTLAASSPQLAEWQAKCVVIPYGIRTNAEPNADALARAEAIRAEHRRPLVLFVGRLVPYKGADVLLNAMRGISATVLIVGGGPEREALERQAAELGLGDAVTFLGDVSDEELEALYLACDLFVLPSVTRQEAFGVVQIEAMARGKPVVSTDLGTGVAWVNQHGETGLVVPPRDTVALHTAIEQLVDDPALRGALGSAAARRARSAFAVDRMIDATLALYRDVMAEGIDRGAQK